MAMRKGTAFGDWRLVAAITALCLLGCGGPKPSAALANPPPVPKVAPAPAVDPPAADPANSPAASDAAATDAATDDAATDNAATDNAATDQRGAAGVGKAPLRAANPFPQQIEVPDFSDKLIWLNTKPLNKKDLKGKFVLLDFWTYCCINCMHILPELKKLEQEFPNNLVVIGVHSAKFETEKDTNNIREAILRYEIEHPVINDKDHELWNGYGVSSWPTIILLDPEGKGVWGRAGEFKAEEVRTILNTAMDYYRGQKLLDEQPLKFELEASKQEATPLRFPGKILADEKGNRLFISDSNHNRLVITTLDGKLLDVIGSGAIGAGAGDFQSATFNHPQGCALNGDTLYVADTENHLLRKVDLKTKQVTTIAGTGEQGQGWPGIDAVGGRRDMVPARWVGPTTATALNSPWALWVHKKDLYIAMAGPHQIWKMPLDESEIGPYAGNGREDIVDGPLLPKIPFATGFSSFAQPSGLSSDGTWLFVADSEGSSIRAVPFDPRKQVRTVVGSDNLDAGRLFAFGDRDGPRNVAKLQHSLEVVYVAGKIYVADTYNHKIKVVDAKTGETKTLAGNGKAGTSDSPAQFHEPAGLAHAKGQLYVADTNNHLIRTLELSSGKVATLTIEGLKAPAKEN
jgi:thiol-disulfide isomerase/thioredoxin